MITRWGYPVPSMLWATQGCGPMLSKKTQVRRAQMSTASVSRIGPTVCAPVAERGSRNAAVRFAGTGGVIDLPQTPAEFMRLFKKQRPHLDDSFVAEPGFDPGQA